MKKSIILVAITLIGCNKNKDNQLHQNINKPTTEITQVVDSATTQLGLKYAQETQKVLGKNLMNAIKNDGVLGALQFCNHQAYPLTDSMAVQFNAHLKRVSDKPRNPNNKANDEELIIIENYKKIVAEEGEIMPISNENNGKLNIYYPIVTNAMCLQCHGTPNQQLASATINKIAELYPTDKAKGYSENQVRGIWHVTMDKK